MSDIVVIGAESLIRGYGLAGAALMPAADADAVRRAWRTLPGDVALVILTADAARALDERDRESTWPLSAVMDP
jgi:vacuolar-type H+-ATPase subunit F/Vma7